MKKDDKIKGGKADKLSVEDIAKKHDVSVKSIKDQIEMGKKIEMEHVDDKELAKEIAMDHLEEIPDYYTRLKKMEKEAKKELSLEAKRFMALAGIKEGDKKFLTNESFSESKDAILYPEGWKEMDGMFMGPNRITSEKISEALKQFEENKKDDDLIIHEFEQIDVEPGKDDDQVYKIKMPNKD